MSFRAANLSRWGEPVPLPQRYDEWFDSFWAHMRDKMRPGVRVLDVGSGRRPTVGPSDRPAGCFYVGLDVSGGELESAPPGSYDDIVLSDVTAPVPALKASFDLIVSWQVFEHIRPLESALDALHSYLRPGGCMIAFFSGRFSVHGIVNLITSQAGARVVALLAGRDAATIFPAYYHNCYASRLRTMLAGWSDVQIEPQWGAAVYFARIPTMQRAYLAYENWAMRSGRADLATHYLLVATS